MKGFISYAHDDIVMLRELQIHLKGTERAYGIRFWIDGTIHGGRRWRHEIQRAIGAAHVFLLLVSHRYLASDFINEHELPAIEARLRSPGTTAIPVILLPCGWKTLLGEVQAVPTIDGQDKPIAQWQPEHEGYDRAREQIEASLRHHFDIVPIIRGLANPFKPLGENPAGVRWVEQQERFARDTEGGVLDARAAMDPGVAQLHEGVVRQAEHFAATATRLDNLHGWSDIKREARRLADAVGIAAPEVPGRIAGIYAAVVSLASFLHMNNRVRQGELGLADPLDAAVERELSNLVEIAAVWIRQFPAARELDDALARWRRGEFATGGRGHHDPVGARTAHRIGGGRSRRDGPA